jgi:hypothetical protein
MTKIADPSRQLNYLQQCLSSDKEPLGLFLGAGCPMAVRVGVDGKVAADPRHPPGSLSRSAMNCLNPKTAVHSYRPWRSTSRKMDATRRPSRTCSLTSNRSAPSWAVGGMSRKPRRGIDHLAVALPMWGRVSVPGPAIFFW